MKTSKIEKWILIISATALIIFAIVYSVKSQTIQELDQRLKRVEDSLGINSIITPPDTNLSLPVYQGIILNGNYDIYPSPYSPPFKDQDGYIKLFIQKAGQPYAVGSASGMNNWIFSSTGNMPRGTVLKENLNTYKDAYHEWYNGLCYFRFAGSYNSYSWSDMALIRTPYGEDITFIIDQGKYRAYARPNIPPAIRTIGYMESSDFRNWTPLVEVLKPDAMDGLNQFYSMSVIHGNYGYFGFLNVFNTSTDHVGVQLVFSENGKDGWQRLFNRQEVLIKKNGVKCLYACAGVIEGEVWIATISCKFSHTENDRNGQYYFTELYKISINDLQKFIK